MRLYIGLVHYPVYNKNRRKIAAAITPVDLHDIARAAKTFGVRRFFVINPLQDQRRLAERVRRHWIEGYGSRYNQHRKEAMELLRVVPSLDSAIVSVTKAERETPLVVATDAAPPRGAISYEKARALVEGGRVVILIFGTGWGLDQAYLERADHVLEPVSGRTEYNHLSVRSAAAIILDRLAGRFHPVNDCRDPVMSDRR